MTVAVHVPKSEIMKFDHPVVRTSVRLKTCATCYRYAAVYGTALWYSEQDRRRWRHK
jgi:hypothetical protein